MRRWKKTEKASTWMVPEKAGSGRRSRCGAGTSWRRRRRGCRGWRASRGACGRGRGRAGLGQHDEDAGEGEDELGEEGEDVGVDISSGPPSGQLWPSWLSLGLRRLEVGLDEGSGLAPGRRRVHRIRLGGGVGLEAGSGWSAVQRCRGVSMASQPEGGGDAHDEEEGDEGPEGEVLAGVEVAWAGLVCERRPRSP